MRKQPRVRSPDDSDLANQAALPVSNTTVSTSSGSSDTGMSPSSASPAQNTVAVECR